jgi:hypothetical protein
MTLHPTARTIRMSAMSKLSVSTAAVVGIVLLGMQSPAVAARVTFDDKTGDAKARLDLMQVTLGNNERSVSVKAEIRELLPTGAQTFGLTMRPQGLDGNYGASTVRHTDGTVTAELWRFDGDGSHLQDCDVRARWRPGKDVIRLWFPQSCLPVQRRASMAAFTIDGEDANALADDWTRDVPVPFD